MSSLLHQARREADNRLAPNLALAADEGKQLVFRFPRVSLLLLALGIALLGLFFVCGYTAWPAYYLDWDQEGYAGWVVGGLLSVCTAVLTIAALLTEVELRIDADTERARLRLRTPVRRASWERAFDEFAAVRLTRVRDNHGLPNHWRLELRDNEGRSVMLGYGLFGTFRRAPAQLLAQRLAGLLGLPCEGDDAK